MRAILTTTKICVILTFLIGTVSYWQTTRIPPLTAEQIALNTHIQWLENEHKDIFTPTGAYIGFKRNLLKTYFPKRKNITQEIFTQTGLASFYNENSSDGKLTANGEIFNSQNLTAAHPYLPLPSIVKVTNLTNGKEIYVRVNDRGPYIKHKYKYKRKDKRIIDLSEKAISQLDPDYNEDGLIAVKIEVDWQQTKLLHRLLKI